MCPQYVFPVATSPPASDYPVGIMADRPTDTSDLPLYPTDLAFVVELRRDAEIGTGLCLGRVEHLASGRVARFVDGEALLKFLAAPQGEEPSAPDPAPLQPSAPAETDQE
jgi:hypothetical protein